MKENCEECKENPQSGPCPFASEIHGDESECDCCDDCRYQCAMDI